MCTLSLGGGLVSSRSVVVAVCRSVSRVKTAIDTTYITEISLALKLHDAGR